MATASVPPGMAAAMDRERDLQRRLHSQDSVERWKAREQLAISSEAEAGRIAAGIAQRTEAAYFGEIARCERIDRETMAQYKPLPRGARVIKNDN